MAQVHHIEGSVVDGYCPKCENTTEHTIVKATKRSVREVRCESCHHVHKYRKTAGKAKAKRSRKKTQEVDDLAQITSEWEGACLDASAEEPRDYDMNAPWPLGSVILHPVFGKGVVLKVLSDKKIEVIFQNARKKLVQKA